MSKIVFKSIIERFEDKGEKTGWTYVNIPEEIAQKINPKVKKIYQVKGSIDELKIKQISIFPMGDGDFILPLNATMRKKIGKILGFDVELTLEVDSSEHEYDEEFLACLNADEVVKNKFDKLLNSQKKYFDKWISSAKTIETKTKRITIVLNSLEHEIPFNEMMRNQKKDII